MLSSSNIYRFNHQYDRQRDTDSFDSAYTDTTSGLYSDYEKYVQIKSGALNKTFECNLSKMSLATDSSPNSKASRCISASNTRMPKKPFHYEWDLSESPSAKGLDFFLFARKYFNVNQIL
jgi:hypothetical protein